MSKRARRLLSSVVAITIILSLMMIGYTSTAVGAADGGRIITNISKLPTNQTSVFPHISVDPNNPDNIAVAWRVYKLPIDTNAAWDVRVADCHISVSSDGGETFIDYDMMPLFRSVAGEDLPDYPHKGMWFANGPWATYGSDGVLYAGCQMFTPLGDTMAMINGQIGYPKQGRVVFAASKDNGATWGEAKYGIKFSNFAEGVTGLNVSNLLPSSNGIPNGQPGTDPWHTPWDGSYGIASSTTTDFFHMAGGVICHTDDGAETFDLCQRVRIPAGWSGSTGTLSVDGSMLVMPFFATGAPAGVTTPCVAFMTSNDYGATWNDPVVAAGSGEFADFNRSGTIRYPISATAPNAPGHWAVATYTADHNSVRLFYTEDAGKTWNTAKVNPPDAPEGIIFTNANQVGVGYTAYNEPLVVWRSYSSWCTYYVYAALLGPDGSFGPTVMVSPEQSVYPYQITQGNYGQNSGGGDFTTWITGNDDYALVAFPYGPGGVVLDTYFARIPLTVLGRTQVPPVQKVDVSASAFITKLSGNQNELTITVTDFYSDGSREKFTESFSIKNNAADYYTVGPYKVYVETKGNDQIRECYIVK